MAQQTMYPAAPNSPATQLSAAATDTATTISVVDASKLPAAPNLATIGVDETAEVVLYTGKTGNDLTGVTRGFSGTAAKAWSAGVNVARYFTSYDADAMRVNIADIIAQKGAANGIGTLDGGGRQPAGQLPLSAVQATTADITYYVNNSTGNDTNDGLTTATALKTRAAAIAKIPQTVNHNVNIIMLGGESGTLTLLGYNGKGKVTVKGQTTTASNYALNAIVLKNCSCSIDIENVAVFNATGTNIDISGCADVYIGNVNVPQSNTGAGILANSSFVTVAASVITNQTYGIVANRSVVYSYNNSGTGNTIGLVADQAGTIGKGGTQPSGTTAELQQGGGVVR